MIFFICEFGKVKDDPVCVQIAARQSWKAMLHFPFTGAYSCQRYFLGSFLVSCYYKFVTHLYICHRVLDSARLAGSHCSYARCIRRWSTSEDIKNDPVVTLPVVQSCWWAATSAVCIGKALQVLGLRR